MRKTTVKTGKEAIDFAEKPILGSEIATRQAVGLGFNYISYLPDPDEILRKQGKDISVYQDILNDGRLTSALEQRFSEVLSMIRDIDQGDATTQQFEFFKAFMKAHDNFEDVIYHTLMAKYFGYTIFEMIWERFENYIAPTKIRSKNRGWFVFNDDLELRFRQAGGLLVEVPKYQFLTVQNRPTYDNPYGERLAAKLFWYVVFKRGGNKFWVKFIEKYGMPNAFAKVPATTSETEKNLILTQLSNLVQDGVGVINNSAEIQIDNSGSDSRSSTNYKELKDYCNEEITQIVLTQTLTSSNDGAGSYALGQVHESRLINLSYSDKVLVERTINRMFALISEYNFGSAPVPIFKLSEKEGVNTALAERDKVLNDIGVDFTEDYFIQKHGLNVGDFTLRGKASEPPKPPAQFSEFPDQDIIEKLADSITENNPELVKNFEQYAKPVIDMIENAGTLKEILSNLESIYPKMGAKQHEKLLRNVIFIAENYGRYSAKS